MKALALRNQWAHPIIWLFILVGHTKNNHLTSSDLCNEEDRHLERDFKTDKKGE